MPDRLDLQYTLSEDDLIRSWRQHFRMKVLRSNWAFLSAVVLATYLLGTIGLAIYCSNWTVVGTVALIMAVLPGLIVFNYFVVVPIAAHRSDLPNKTFEVQVSDGGIAWRGGQIEADSSWSRFVDIAEGNGYFLLYFGQSTYFPIPKRAFPDDAMLNDFRVFVVNRLTKSLPAWTREVGAGLPNDAGDGRIVLQFRLSESDEIRVVRATITRSIAQSKPTLILYGALGLLAICGVALAVANGMRTQYLVMIAPGFIVTPALMNYIWLWPKRLVRKSPTRGRDQTAMVDDGAMFIDTGLTNMRIAWSRIVDVQDMDGLLILFTGNNESTVIAKSGFVSPGDEERFRDIVKRHIPDARILK